MFNYCPSCASIEIQFDGKNRFHCPRCGFVYYHNTAAASGIIIKAKPGILFLVRGEEPAAGKLDLPGGFVDPGEGIIEGLRRECREELGWDCGEGISLFASFPNVYNYKNINYNTCDMFFYVEAEDLAEDKITLQKSEITACRFIPPENINPEDLAFASTRRAVKFFCAGLVDSGRGHFRHSLPVCVRKALETARQ